MGDRDIDPSDGGSAGGRGFDEELGGGRCEEELVQQHCSGPQQPQVEDVCDGVHLRCHAGRIFSLLVTRDVRSTQDDDFHIGMYDSGSAVASDIPGIFDSGGAVPEPPTLVTTAVAMLEVRITTMTVVAALISKRQPQYVIRPLLSSSEFGITCRRKSARA
ncbi:hypothetical protein VPH35_058662 [Triticum aestivum]